MRNLGASDETTPFGVGDLVTNDLVQRLKALLSDNRGPLRAPLAGKPAMLDRLRELGNAMPHLAAANGVVQRSAHLSYQTGAPMVVHPILLVGDPGIGKTRYARSCAEALGTTFAEYSFAQSDDIGVLLGHSVAWRGSQVGLLTRTLLRCDTCSPVILIDEIDKARDGQNAVPLDALHSLLEPTSARLFTDPYLEVHVRADRVIWIATANDVASIRPSMLDRFLVIPVSTPSRAQQMVVIQSIYAELVGAIAYGFSDRIREDVATPLLDQSPRAAKHVVEVALGFAASDGSFALSATDVVRAQRLLSLTETKRGMGFARR
ncbi:MAG: AAA family ATPase [Roseiarcus sp.]